MRRITNRVVKYWYIPIAIVAVAFFVFWSLQEQEKIDPKLEMKMGTYNFNGGEYDLDKAERAFKRAVSADPKILWGHYQLARIYFLKKDFQRALYEINMELDANPENLRALYVRGLIYGYTPDFPKAEADFLRFTLWAPKEWAGYNDLAWILSKESKYAEAETALSLAFKEVRDAGKNPWLLNSLGVAQLNLKKYAEAGKSFKEALHLAANLTSEDWIRAYPGNDPVLFRKGLKEFEGAILLNLKTAVDRDGM